MLADAAIPIACSPLVPSASAHNNWPVSTLDMFDGRALHLRNRLMSANIYSNTKHNGKSSILQGCRAQNHDVIQDIRILRCSKYWKTDKQQGPGYRRDEVAPFEQVVDDDGERLTNSPMVKIPICRRSSGPAHQ